MGEESRFCGGWRGWDGRKKVVFMVDGGDGMREECRFYSGWRGGVKIIISNVVMFMFTVNECQVKVSLVQSMDISIRHLRFFTIYFI